MNRVAALNEEILMIIFNNVESLQQLATCRLVRKAWKNPAANVMFSREIVVDSELKAIRVNRHLLMDPSKAKLITNIRFKFDDTEIPLMVEELLDFAITPSIKVISGSVKSDRFFNKLFTILENESQPCDKLENLPRYTGSDLDIQTKRTNIIKNYITSLSAELKGDALDLSDYIQLKKLTIHGSANVLRNLEDTLRNCPLLTYVRLKGLYCGIFLRAFSIDDVKTWCQENVEQNHQSTQVIINGVCHSQLIQYFVYKYPLGTIEIKGTLPGADWRNALHTGDLECILSMAKSGRIEKITLIMPASTRLKEVAQFFRRRKEEYKIYLKGSGNQEELLMDIMNYGS